MMRRSLFVSLSILLVIVTLSGCVDQKDTRQLPSSKDDDVERLATPPVPVTGARLVCGYIETPEAPSNTVVGCNPYEGSDSKLIDLDITGVDVKWSYESELNVVFTPNYTDANNVRWQARFDFSSADGKDRQTRVLESKITLNFTKKGTLEKVQIQDRLKNTLMELAEHRFIKIAYQSIHMNAPAQTTELPDTVDFEFKINGIWEKVEVKLDTLDFIAKTMQTQRFNLQFNGSESDWKMYLQTGMGKGLAAKYTSTPEILSWNRSSGTSWIFNADSSFESQAPYDLKAGKSPIELYIDLGIKQRFNGFRMDGGLDNPGRALPNGFPDRFFFLYSDDNKTWRKIFGSESAIEGRSKLEWSWDQ